MIYLCNLSEYLMNGRKFSTRANVAGAGGSRHRDKKKLETDARTDNRADKELSRAVNRERFDPNVQ